MKKILALMLILFATPVFASEPVELDRKNCSSGFSDWCSGLVNGGCWHCDFDSYEECKRKIQSTSDEICVHKSDAK